MESRWNPLESSGIIASIPPEFQLEFLKIQDGILLELLPAFRRHSTGILQTTPARISLEFYRNCRLISSQNPLESSGIIAGIPPEFQWNSTSISAEFCWNCWWLILLGFCTVLQLKFHWNFTGSRRYISTGTYLPNFQKFQSQVDLKFARQ